MENQVLDVDELAGDPHAGGRVEEMPPLDEALANGAAAHGLVEACELVFGPSDGWKQGLEGQFPDFISRCKCVVFISIRKLLYFLVPSHRYLLLACVH